LLAQSLSKRQESQQMQKSYISHEKESGKIIKQE